MEFGIKPQSREKSCLLCITNEGIIIVGNKINGYSRDCTGHGHVVDPARQSVKDQVKGEGRESPHLG